MNRSALKTYAPKARRDFIAAVTARAAKFGITASKVEPVRVQGEVALIGDRAHPRKVAEQRDRLETRIRIRGFEQVMEAAAYSWFNRFAAIRFMEIHGYLDHGFRVLSHPEGKPQPEILEHAQHLDFPELDMAKVIELKLDGTKDGDLYRMLLLAQCNALNGAMPFLFERIDDETELLLPDNLLHSDSVIRQMVNEIDEADWREIEIIGWLYQFYISEKKDEVIGKVVKSEDIPAATQLFTPNWIVKYMVQNTLGAKWLATYPQSGICAKMEYYIEPAEQTAEVNAKLAEITPKELNPEEITFLDPACGSGHILVEAYDLYKEIYLERGYVLREIPRLILEKNLFGLDIDDRAAQLSCFALLMKAREDDRRILARPPELNVMAIQESKGLDAEEICRVLAPNEKFELVPSNDLFPDLLLQPILANPLVSRQELKSVSILLDNFTEAKTFGSLIMPSRISDTEINTLSTLVREHTTRDLFSALVASATSQGLAQILLQTKILLNKYNCVVANPPYMGAKYMNNRIKAFANRYFTESKSDLFSMFIDKCYAFCKSNNYVALVTMENWMFLPTFEEIRNKVIAGSIIRNLIHMPYEGKKPVPMGINFGTSVFSAITANITNFNGIFARQRYTDLTDSGHPKSINNLRDGYVRNTSSFSVVVGHPLAYWLSHQMRDAFVAGTLLKDIAQARQGMATADNDRFVRCWWEVSIKEVGFYMTSRSEATKSGLKWFPYNKGGPWRKWFGNQLFIVNWKNDGEEIRNFMNDEGRQRSAVRNDTFYFSRAISWSDITSALTSFRAYPSGFIHDVTGMSAFTSNDDDFNIVLGFCNTKIVGALTKAINPTLHFQIGNYQSLPLIYPTDKAFVISLVDKALSIAESDHDLSELSWSFASFPLLHDLRIKTIRGCFNEWETRCDTNISQMRELEASINRIFIASYALEGELTPDIREDEITLARANSSDDTKQLFSYAIGCTMGRYSLDEPGLIYANSGNVGFDPSRYVKFPADADGIVPIMQTDWFEDDATVRFVEFLKVAWSPETLTENLKFVADSLGPKSGETPVETVRRYFSNEFWKDHVKTYKKRPIYWLFSSGKEKAFEALVYLHRYNDGTLSRMRMEYVTPLQGRIASRIDQLARDAESASGTAARNKLLKEAEKLKKQQAELRRYDEELRHYADKRITLDLDDGVKVNYGKFGNLLSGVNAITGGSDE